jgi:3-hydroxyacyl-CoA dehydrogenase/enoyl-CoA hydratase/3-hydroxybutyryl-CoA epimerase
MTTSKNAQLGLPESLVGLLPGAGGTQRLPRLVDMETALRVLLDGGRLNAAQALEKGLVVALVAPGHEIEAAEQWILQSTDARQPWDKAGSAGKSEAAHARIARERQARRRLPNGHYPAPLAILDCIEGGLDAPMDQALAHEMTVFSRLIQRPEPRAMIRALFMGRLDHDRLAAKGALPRQLQAVLEHASIGLERACEVARAQGVDEESIARARNFAGFAAANSSSATGNEEADARDADGYWFESPGATAIESLAAAMIFGVAGAVKDDLDGLQQMEINAVDYVASSQIQFPAYLGGPLALARRVASHGAA